MKMVFFGGSEFSVYVLEELKVQNILAKFVITTPDRPKGRKLVLTPTPVKVWAQKNNIEVIDPISLKKDNTALISKLLALNPKLFLVASYGKIIPKEIFEIPKNKTLNIHPSLLPKYRGASPIQSQILNDEKKIGVTVMQIDEGMDTGPIIVQKMTHLISEPSPKGEKEEGRKDSINFFPSLPFGNGVESGMVGRKELEKFLAIEGAKLFTQVLPDWLDGKIKSITQNSDEATFCQKINKEDGELQIDLDDLSKNAYQNLLKIKAFEEWPTAYFYTERNGKKIRIIITDAALENNLSSPNSRQPKLKILKVIPEGKPEMSYQDFLRGQKIEK